MILSLFIKELFNIGCKVNILDTNANGANGVFSYGGNGGIMTTGGGTTYAYDLDITTSGQSSAASGNNIATLKASSQKLTGAIKVGSDSSLTLEISDNSTFYGYIDGKITNAEGSSISTDVGKVSVTLDSSSTWTLTGDSYVTEFNGNPENVISNGYTLYVNGVALTGAK